MYMYEGNCCVCVQVITVCMYEGDHCVIREGDRCLFVSRWSYVCENDHFVCACVCLCVCICVCVCVSLIIMYIHVCEDVLCVCTETATFR